MFAYLTYVCLIDKQCVTIHKIYMNEVQLYGDIGARIKARRVQLKWTQAKLASAIQMSRPSLANIEQGRQGILVHQLFIIADRLRLQVTDLLPIKSELSNIADNDVELPSNLTLNQQQQIKAMISGNHTNNQTLTQESRLKK